MLVPISPKDAFENRITVPGDKSISHRLIMLASLADGVSDFENLLLSEDCMSTIEAFRHLGIKISIDDSNVKVYGEGIRGLKPSSENIYVGNSGTTMRLMAGILSGQPFKMILSGDNSLSTRPMGRIVEPLTMMGANIRCKGHENRPPIEIIPSKLKAITFHEKKGSAQVKSAILLAGLFAEGKTVVIEEKPSRNHTENLLPLFGAPFRKEDKHLIIEKAQYLRPASFSVPGDISSAAYFMVAACISKKGKVVLDNVNLNTSRDGIVEVLKKMGADIEIIHQDDDIEPRGQIVARASTLKGITIGGEIIPRLIDEIPIIMVAAVFSQGTTIIKDAQELRVKESDRIQAMVENLQKIGAQIKETVDGVIIQGCDKLKGGCTINSFFDHRIAMSLAIAGLRCDKEISINDAECVNISFPQFYTILNNM